MTAMLTTALALLTVGGIHDLRTAIVGAPAASALALVAWSIVAGTQAALLVAGPRSSPRRIARAGAIAGFVPLALFAPAAALALAALAMFPQRYAANDNLPVALGL